jgi:lipid A 3-O-deacylase
MIQAFTLVLIASTAEYQPLDIHSLSSLTLGSTKEIHQSQPNEQPENSLEVMLPVPTSWGKEGTWRWGINGGWAEDAKDANNTLVNLGVEFEYFVNDNLSLDLGLYYLDVNQVGVDTTGVNLTLQLRWHFIAKETWSMFMECGAGLLRTSNDVPSDGSSFNFTPQAGLGFTFDIGNNNRWIIGTRWYHMSNANTYASNPGRDSFMIWTGISFPY